MIGNVESTPLSRHAQVRIALGIVAAGLVTVGVTAFAATPAEEQQQFADGLFSRGLYDLAIREYMALLRAAPDYPRLDLVLYRLAECYRETGNPAAADLFYRRVIQEHPASEVRPRAELRRVELFIAAGRFEDAGKLITELLARSPPKDIAAAAEYYQGVVAAGTNDLATAEARYRTVMKKYEGTAHFGLAAFELAALCQKSGAPTSELYVLYRTAAEKAPSTNLAAEAWLRLGDAAYAANDWTTAVEAYGRLLKDFPDHARTRDARLPAAWSWLNLGRAAEALELARQAMERDGDTPEWLYLAANAHRKLLDAERALELYDALLRQHSTNTLAEPAAFESATVLFRQQRYDAVIQRLRDRTWAPNLQPEVDWLLAESYLHSGSTNLAIQHYRRLVESAPSSERAPDALYQLGRLLADRGAHAEASELWRALATRRPDHPLAPAALHASALSQCALGQWEEAIADWDRLMRTAPSSPLLEAALFDKAMTEIRLKRDGNAQESLRTLLQKFPQTSHAADARFWLGVLAERGKDLAAAESEYRAALALQPRDELRRKIQLQLAGVLRQKGATAEAADLIQELLHTPVRDQMGPSMLEWLATARLDQQQYDRAAEAATKLLESAPDEPWRQVAGYLLARAKLGLGDRPGALEALRQAASGQAVTRARIEALLELGRLCLDAKDIAKGQEYYRQAAELCEADELAELKARALFGMAVAARVAGDLDAAARYFLSVAILYDHPAVSPEALYRAAEIFEAQSQFERAAKLRQELQQRYPNSEWARRLSNPSSR